MKAIGHTAHRPLEADDHFTELQVDMPIPRARDLRVRVKAVAVNPIDLKVYGRPVSTDKPAILGFDCAGVVESVGAGVSLFKPGDPVYYAGTVIRAGCNAEYHCVDERLVGHKPEALDFADSASIALAGLTAYELLFDLMHVDEPGVAGEAILVIGGAGGVASMAVQLLTALTDRPIVATASRDESAEWARAMGAHYIINHQEDYGPQLEALNAPPIGAVFSTHTSEHAWAHIRKTITPFGRIGYIDDPKMLDIRVLKQKSVTLYGEGMFNRSVFESPDMVRQHEILNHIAQLTDAGRLRAITGRHFGTLNTANLIAAHRHVATGRALGKAVLDVIA